MTSVYCFAVIIAIGATVLLFDKYRFFDRELWVQLTYLK